jgi:hypothetical protein
MIWTELVERLSSYLSIDGARSHGRYSIAQVPCIK